MIPPEQQMSVPDGIDDATTRAIVQLIEERFGSIPVDKAIVWRADTLVESAIPHMRAGLGLDKFWWMPNALLEEAVEFADRLGTASAVEDALAGLGHTAYVHEGTNHLYADGALCADGTFTADGHWAKFWVVFVGPMLSEESKAKALDAIKQTQRRTSHLAGLFCVFAEEHFGVPAEYSNEHTVPVLLSGTIPAAGNVLELTTSRDLSEDSAADGADFALTGTGARASGAATLGDRTVTVPLDDVVFAGQDVQAIYEGAELRSYLDTPFATGPGAIVPITNLSTAEVAVLRDIVGGVDVPRTAGPAAWVAGPGIEAVTCNGVTQYLRTAGVSSVLTTLLGSFTISALVRIPTQASANNRTIFEFSGPGETEPDNGLKLRVISTGFPGLFWETGAGVNVSANATTKLTAGTWVLVSARVTRAAQSTVDLLSNGVVTDAGLVRDNLTGGSNGGLALGSARFPATEMFVGDIALIDLCNSAMSDSYLADLAADPNSAPPPECVHRWRLRGL